MGPGGYNGCVMRMISPTICVRLFVHTLDLIIGGDVAATYLIS